MNSLIITTVKKPMRFYICYLQGHDDIEFHPIEQNWKINICKCGFVNIHTDNPVDKMNVTFLEPEDLKRVLAMESFAVRWHLKGMSPIYPKHREDDKDDLVNLSFWPPDKVAENTVHAQTYFLYERLKRETTGGLRHRAGEKHEH